MIRYSGEPVAVVVNGDLALLAPELEARGSSDPLRRFASAMCQLAMELELGLADGAYRQERAELYARELLMPARQFAALGWLPDAHLATCFRVPPEQVPTRRRELGLAARSDRVYRRPPGRHP